MELRAGDGGGTGAGGAGDEEEQEKEAGVQRNGRQSCRRYRKVDTYALYGCNSEARPKGCTPKLTWKGVVPCREGEVRLWAVSDCISLERANHLIFIDFLVDLKSLVQKNSVSYILAPEGATVAHCSCY